MAKPQTRRTQQNTNPVDLDFDGIAPPLLFGSKRNFGFISDLSRLDCANDADAVHPIDHRAVGLRQTLDAAQNSRSQLTVGQQRASPLRARAAEAEVGRIKPDLFERSFIELADDEHALP